MTSTTAPRPTVGAGADRRRRTGAPELPLSERGRRRVGFALLAAVAYLPVLLMHMGKVEADTKTYLYLDPGRLLARAGSLWDPNIGTGTVSHQNIGYLFPMGPLYWFMERVLELPAWVAQRIWLGSLLFAAGLGMRYLLRTIGMRGPGVVVGVLAYMFTPYVLQYSARLSVILGPWAALPWWIAFVVLALRSGSWKYPALFAITVQLVGGVNATALIFAGIAPVLWIPYSVWILRETHWRRAVRVVLQVGVLSLVTSLWWMAGLWAQGKYGLDVLKYTETLQTVSHTSYANEVLRGLGYWFFYGQDKLGPWSAAASDYTQHIWLILVSYALPSLALLSAVVIRWRYRAFFVLIALIGVIIAVGASPFDHPTVLGGIFKAFASSSTAGLALRSTARAVPLLVLGFAALLAAGVTAAYDALVARGLGVLGLVSAGLVCVLVIVGFPVLWDGKFYNPNLERPERIPTYWTQALKYLDSQSHDTRVLALPGSDFASYRWGSTVDPIEPGLMDRPYVARELIPWGSAPSADLLRALDRRVQEGWFEPQAIAPIARLMGVGDVLLRLDLQTDRYALVRPRTLWQDFSPDTPPGLQPAKTFGTKIPGKPKFQQLDEEALTLPANQTAPPPVAVLGVNHPLPIVHATTSSDPTVVDGDGEGLMDVSAAGALDTNHVVLYSPSYANDAGALRTRVRDGATLVVTDSNRRRAQRWSTVRDNYGYTEQAGEKPLRTDVGDQRLDVFPQATDADRTVTQQRGVDTVQATRYGNALSYTAEDRPSRAFDGDTTTAWKVGAFEEVRGERIQLKLHHAITTNQVNLLQPLNGLRDRFITKVTLRFDGGHPVTVPLGDASLDLSGEGQLVHFPKRRFKTFSVEVADTNVPGGSNKVLTSSPVGFSEIRLRDDHPGSKDVRVDEVVQMPRDLLAATGASSLRDPLVLTMTRDRAHSLPRYDPELDLTRDFVLPTARTFSLAGTVRLDPGAPGSALDSLVGMPGLDAGGTQVTTSRSLEGDVQGRGSSAVDGDPGTAWNTPFRGAVGDWIKVQTPQPITVDHLNLQLVNDGRHSVPTELEVTGEDGRSQVVVVPSVPDQKQENATVTVPVHFAATTGRSLTVSIAATRPVRTLEYFTEAKIQMPVGIAELGIPGLAPQRMSPQLVSTCRDDLVTMDGKPVSVRFVGDSSSANNYGPASLELCDPSGAVSLGPGEHVLRTVKGRLSGIDFDRIVLSSAAGGAAASVSAVTAAGDPPVSAVPGAARSETAPSVKVVRQGRTSMTVRVDHATKQFWMVLGQSQNAGWVASVGGHDLGAPKLVDGYANGWLVTPSRSGGTITVKLNWTPQRVVWISVALSVLGGLVCVAIIVWAFVRRRRRRSVGTPADSPSLENPLVAGGHRPGRLAVAACAVLAGGVTAVIVRPWCGVLVAGVVLLVLVRPRWRAVLTLFPPLALGFCGVFIAAKQFVYKFPPQFEWAPRFWQLRTLGWLAIVFVAVDVIVGLVRGAEPRDEPRRS